MAVKRKLEFEPSELQEPTNIITVHGVLMSVSPISTGKKTAFSQVLYGKADRWKESNATSEFQQPFAHIDTEALQETHTDCSWKTGSKAGRAQRERI